jgi:Mce-associated membrane protein
MIRRPVWKGTYVPVIPARLLVGALTAVVVLLAAAVAWLVVQERDAQARADERQAVLQVAGAHAVNLLSLNYETIEADVARILATSTGAARAEYEAGADKLKDTTTANKVVQEGVLRAAGLVSVTGGTAKALVVADVEIRWDGSKSAPQERFYRWAMDLTKVRGMWLVSKAVQVA